MKPAMRPTLHRWFGSPSLVALLGAAALLGGCAGTATTQVTITPPDPAPVCAPAASGPVAVFWRTQWRADQKDVTEREAAAAQGIQRFFSDGRCFTLATVARTTEIGSTFDVPAGADRLVVLTVRELGPVVGQTASTMATEAVKLICGFGAPLFGRVEIADARVGRHDIVTFAPRAVTGS